MSDAAFAKDYAGWDWRDGVKAAMDYGNFDWDDPVESTHYDPIQTPKLLIQLGTSPRSTRAQKRAGRALALNILSCVRVAEMTNNVFGEGDTLYEHQLFGWPAGVFMAQSLKLPARDVREALRAVERRLAPMMVYSAAGKDSEAAASGGNVLAEVCPQYLTRQSDVIDMILADRYGMKPKFWR